MLALHFVLHEPNLNYNLLSVGKITKDLNCSIEFTLTDCYYQDHLEKMIGHGKLKNGLYNLETDWRSGGKVYLCLLSTHKTGLDRILLWHNPHPTPPPTHTHPAFVKKVVPSLVEKINISKFHCEPCTLAKHHCVSFPIKEIQYVSPFNLIHSDVWGPSHVTNISSAHWFVTFIDDCTRTTWIYLMKSKSEVPLIFSAFHKFVNTLFGAKIQKLRSDNGKEYLNQKLMNSLSNEGILH